MWYDELFNELELIGNEEQSIKMAAYMKDQFVFLGIPKPKRQVFVKKHLNNTRKQDIDWGFIYACWDRNYREAQYIGIDYLLMHEKQLTSVDLEHIRFLVTNRSWWETVDALDEAAGTIILKEPELKDEMLSWSVDENMWLRRVAIDFQQKYKTQTDTALLEAIIVNNLESKEFFINKAIGWSLREYSKIDPQWVTTFVDNYRSKMNSLSIREACKLL